ncbi:MAG: hypothetical protein HYR94_22335 [Chloroflexi bacterium]|nr:hypothetical protein [Chloroflexota bacterium]
MSVQTATLSKPSIDYGLGRLHLLLLVQSVDVILVSINRLSTLTTGYVAANEFLRWVDLLNMLVLPLISMVAFYLLKKEIEYNSPAREGRWHMALNLTYIIGLYLLAASYGDHEVTNYLHIRFCLNDETSPLCQIIIFNDDEFSHWVFFTGFVMVNAALMFLQIVFPYRGQATTRDWALLAVNGLFIALGIFANLAFEVIGLDLYVVALLAIMALTLLWRRGSQPLVIYYSTAYTLGLVATAIYKLL